MDGIFGGLGLHPQDAVYDLKAVNPNARTDQDTRTPTELLDFIEAKGREVRAALARLRAM